MPNARDRSPSGEVYDSDTEAVGPGKPGRKKNPNSQAARRDQNRIAQREFRLRKQQRIRDLEARVEILSGGQDEALTEIRNILKDLMEENQTLRNLLRGVSAFIGEGAGGLLPKMGWTLSDFNDFINRSETDTAWESYQKRKKSATNQSLPPDPLAQKRPADVDNSTVRTKKHKGADEHDDESERSQDRFNLLMPISSRASPHSYSGSARSHDGGLFRDIMQSSTGSPVFVPSPASVSPSNQYSGTPSSNVSTYQPPYMSPINIVDPPLPFPSTNAPGPVQPRLNQVPQISEVEDSEDPGKQDEYKLIRYHLDNYKRNNNYCLPASLRPTLVQRNIPHQSIIDGILHPDLRDRMILLAGRFDLADCLLEYRNSVTIHGDDVLTHANWEIGESWLRRYGFLIDQPTLNIANRWRRERGEPELLLSDLVPADQTLNPT